MNATIVRAWTDAEKAYMALAVDEGEKDANGNSAVTEYIGSIPIALYNELDAKHQQAVLIAACKAVRTAQKKSLGEQELAHRGTVKI